MKPLICLLGVSGCGKSTIANRLERKFGYTSVKSYTTRPVRTNDENDINTHTFITMDEVDKYKNDIVADNWFNNNYYFATATQLNCCDIYVIDKAGLEKLRENYHDKKIIAIYLDVPTEIVAKRMEQRGDNDKAIMSRLQHDTIAFAGAKDMCEYICDNSTQDKCVEICEFIDMILRYCNG